MAVSAVAVPTPLKLQEQRLATYHTRVSLVIQWNPSKADKLVL